MIRSSSAKSKKRAVTATVPKEQAATMVLFLGRVWPKAAFSGRQDFEL